MSNKLILKDKKIYNYEKNGLEDRNALYPCLPCFNSLQLSIFPSVELDCFFVKLESPF